MYKYYIVSIIKYIINIDSYLNSATCQASEALKRCIYIIIMITIVMQFYRENDNDVNIADVILLLKYILIN